MHTILLLAVLHGGISIAPIRVFQPYPYVKCPRGYSLWWPAGKEFNNDEYAECIKPARTTPIQTAKNARHASRPVAVSAEAAKR